MESGTSDPVDSNPEDDDAIFKSLTHPVRRQAIKLFRGGKTLSFSDIKKQLDPIDSPTLAYHMKSLQALISPAEGKYKLTDIGIAALTLLYSVDQGTHIKRVKHRFLRGHTITSICWTVANNTVPFIYFSSLGSIWSFVLIIIVLNTAAIINQYMMGRLRKDD